MKKEVSFFREKRKDPIADAVKFLQDIGLPGDQIINDYRRTKELTNPAGSPLEEDDNTCPDCEGSGEVACETWFNNDGMTTCDRCNGKGLI